MPPKISIIIPVHNGEATLDECLRALHRNDYLNREIIVVDDVSTDRSVEIARANAATIIMLDEKSGPATARNWGALAATGDILFFIDADVKVPSDALSLVSCAFEDTSVEAITGLFSDIQRYKNFSSEYKNLWMNHTYEKLEGTVSVFYTSGAAVLRDVFLDVGNFDENYRRPSIEDTDFGHRLKEDGHDIYINKGLAVEHIKKYSLRSMLQTDFMRSAALTKLFIRRGLILRNHTNSTSVPGTFIISVFLLFACLLFLVTGSMFTKNEICVAAGILYVLFLAANHSFLKSLLRKKGLGFLLKSIPVITVDTLVAGLGVATGCIGYMMGERY